MSISPATMPMGLATAWQSHPHDQFQFAQRFQNHLLIIASGGSASFVGYTAHYGNTYLLISGTNHRMLEAAHVTYGDKLPIGDGP